MAPTLDGADLESLQRDLAILQHIAGLHVGQLTEDERRVFEKAVSEGRAFRDYSSLPAYALGIAKVALVTQSVQP